MDPYITEFKVCSVMLHLLKSIDYFNPTNDAIYI